MKSPPLSLSQLLALPDLDTMSLEEIRAEYDARGYSMAQDLAMLEKLASKATPPPVGVIIAVGEHAEDVLEAGLLSDEQTLIVPAYDERSLRAVLDLYSETGAVVVALVSGPSPVADRLLRLAAILRPAVPRLRIRMPGPYLRGAAVSPASVVRPARGCAILVIGAPREAFYGPVASALGSSVTVHTTRPGSTLPADLERYPIVILLNGETRLESRVRHPAVVMCLFNAGEILNATWAIPPMRSFVAQLSARATFVA